MIWKEWWQFLPGVLEKSCGTFPLVLMKTLKVSVWGEIGRLFLLLSWDSNVWVEEGFVWFGAGRWGGLNLNSNILLLCSVENTCSKWTTKSLWEQQSAWQSWLPSKDNAQSVSKNYTPHLKAKEKKRSESCSCRSRLYISIIKLSKPRVNGDILTRGAIMGHHLPLYLAQYAWTVQGSNPAAGSNQPEGICSCIPLSRSY